MRRCAVLASLYYMARQCCHCAYIYVRNTYTYMCMSRVYDMLHYALTLAASRARMTTAMQWFYVHWVTCDLAGCFTNTRWQWGSSQVPTHIYSMWESPVPVLYSSIVMYYTSGIMSWTRVRVLWSPYVCLTAVVWLLPQRQFYLMPVSSALVPCRQGRKVCVCACP